MIKTCAHCHARYPTNKSTQLTCSYACRNKSRAKLSRDALLHFTERGYSIASIARLYRVTGNTVNRSIRREGLYSQWRRARYAEGLPRKLRSIEREYGVVT